MTKCDKCSSRAIIFQRYSGMRLCQSHFYDDVRRKMRQSIRETGIFGHGAKVAVALSGDRKSSAMLHLLRDIFARRRDLEFVAILIDEGISGYRPGGLDSSRALAERLEVPHMTYSFQDAFGTTTDEIALGKKSPCESCRAMRNSLLNQISSEIGADALALGCSLDDLAHEIFKFYIRGDIDGLSSIQNPNPCNQQGNVEVIMPLRRVPEREALLYAVSHTLLPRGCGACPHSKDAVSIEVRRSLSEFESRHPGTKYSLLKSFERITELSYSENFLAGNCEP